MAQTPEERRAVDRATKAAIPLEVKRAYNAAWRATVPDEWRAAKRAYNRERAKRLRDANPEWRNEYRHENIDRIREIDRARYERDKPKRIAIASALSKIRRVRIAGGSVHRVSARDWRRLVNRFGGRCAYCGRKAARLQKDHVVPIARGGRHSIGNLLPACPPCNHSKGARFLVEWRSRQRRGLAA